MEDSGVDGCVFEEAVFEEAVFEEAVFEEAVGGDWSSWAEGELDLVASLGWALAETGLAPPVATKIEMEAASPNAGSPVAAAERSR